MAQTRDEGGATCDQVMSRLQRPALLQGSFIWSSPPCPSKGPEEDLAAIRGVDDELVEAVRIPS